MNARRFALLIWMSISAHSQVLSVGQDARHDTSPPLRTIIAPTSDFKPNTAKPVGLPRVLPEGPVQVDPVIQTGATRVPFVATNPGLNFDGVGNGFSGPNGTFVLNAAPPDTVGAVGKSQYVQWVNASFAVFDKATGAAVLGPMLGNSIWAGFGGSCQTDNDGDISVVYDRAADRWVLSQFAISDYLNSNGASPALHCVAVSATSDATGAYYRYAFVEPNFPDYPKMGIWTDAYYETFNEFNLAGTTFLGGLACAFDRSKMLFGQGATQVCFLTPYASLLPANLDGPLNPPTGAPNFLMNLGANSVNLYKFHVDFITTGNSTFTGPTTLAVAAFTPACSRCVPQPGTTTQLDSLGDRLMHRLAYRNFGDHEAIVAAHSVTAGSSTGIRWYQIYNPSTAPVVSQQGTFAPDANYRWMPSIAMDRVGDIAVGYSVSSSSLYPAVRYTGRVSNDAAGVLEAEASIHEGAGSQTGGLTRWGDYSAMTIDPVDDCTFWYTNEYIPVNGEFNWRTRIASFKFSNCTGGTLPFTTTSISSSINPSITGQLVQFTAAVTGSGAPSLSGNVQFSIDGTNLGSPIALTNGSASSNAISTLTAGSHIVTATYGNDPNYGGSSASLYQTVLSGYGGGVTYLGVSGTGLSTNGNTGAVTITSNATSSNTSSTIVSRDSGGNFSAGTITATLSGNATSATGLKTALTQGGLLFGGGNGTPLQDTNSLFYNAATKALGIGTPNPTAPLTLAGQLSFSPMPLSGSNSRVLFYDYGGGNWAGQGANANGDFWLRTGLSTDHQFVMTSSGNIGIGTPAPSAPLSLNAALAPAVGWSAASRTDAKILLYDYGANNWSGLGADQNGNFWLKTGTSGNGSYLFMNAAGNVGIGTTSPTAQFHTTGTVRFAHFGAGTLTTDASGNITVSSDERLKHIVGRFTRGLADLQKIQPIEYRWTPQSGLDTSTSYFGLSAQNIETSIPEAVYYDKDGNRTLMDRTIIATLVNALREVAPRLEAAEAEIAALKGQIAELKKAK